MAKSLFLLFISGLIGVVMNPFGLAAADKVAVTGISDARAVETIVKKPEPVTSVTSVATAVKAPAAGVAMPVNYTISYYVGSESEYVSTYANLSYAGIYKFRNLVYGHNTGNLLGSLSARYAGEIIKITEGGVTQDYRVAAVLTYEKNADGNLNGDPNLMRSIVYTALGHDVALMTCAGRSLGGGDATHRLVVYADAV